ncbi:sodium/hydrogen exchanger 9B2-like isoform X2 [Lycorma delicatula]|uniref:sodium/hydrogen exchanger 9B2-like isoform X2 n=1 Tax=Lycorma delicatula TaxID=130591 RepID=UPI003F519F8E
MAARAESQEEKSADDEEKHSRRNSHSEAENLLSGESSAVVVTDKLSRHNTPKDEKNGKNLHTNKSNEMATIEIADKEHDSQQEDTWSVKIVGRQCGCNNSIIIEWIGFLILISLSWALLYTLFHNEITPQGDLFKIIALILLAYLAGHLVGLMHLPPLLGMLVTGIALRTIGFYHVSGVYEHIVVHLREFALSVILIKAGLGLDAGALLKLSFVVIRLSLLPCITEAVAAAVISHYIIGYPWLWGLLLGFMLSAVSPAVVVPVLLNLKERGYGEAKGISTLVIAASSIDDIAAISIFGVCLGMLFSEGDIIHQLAHGPIEMVIGFSSGIAWGLLIAYFPHRDDDHVTLKRSVLVGGGGLTAVLGSQLVGYSGAGPLTCITASFTASLCWKLQGWSSNHNPVADVFSYVWLILQPMLFGLIGAEIDLTQLRMDTVGYGLAVIFGALVIRIATCFLVLYGSKLNLKEMIFVNLAWLPKATVQAALAPEALNLVRSQEVPTEDDLLRGSQVLTIAVLSILVTAPLGSIGITIGGPLMLSNQPPTPERTDKIKEKHDRMTLLNEDEKYQCYSTFNNAF